MQRAPALAAWQCAMQCQQVPYGVVQHICVSLLLLLELCSLRTAQHVCRRRLLAVPFQKAQHLAHAVLKPRPVALIILLGLLHQCTVLFSVLPVNMVQACLAGVSMSLTSRKQMGVPMFNKRYSTGRDSLSSTAADSCSARTEQLCSMYMRTADLSSTSPGSRPGSPLPPAVTAGCQPCTQSPETHLPPAATYLPNTS